MRETQVRSLGREDPLEKEIAIHFSTLEDFPGGSDGKASVYNAGDPGSIPSSRRSAGERTRQFIPVLYCLESPMDRGAW